MGENIGACARAMLNFDLTDLRLVNPRDGWPNQRAIDMAVGAFDKMPEPRLFETLDQAIANCHFTLATTARTRDMVKPVFTPKAAARELTARAHQSQKTALIFGAERTGLHNKDAALCSGLITIPTNPDFSSLNLGQAVLLMAYELHQQSGTETLDVTLPTGDSAPVEQARLQEFFERLETELENGHFFRSPELKPGMVNNIRSMFTRSDLTDQEVRTLHGVISALIGNKAGK